MGGGAEVVNISSSRGHFYPLGRCLELFRRVNIVFREWWSLCVTMESV